MIKTFKLWKEIIINPFNGYKGLDDNTKIGIPLVSIIFLFLISTFLLVPIMKSDSYFEAITRVQITNMAEHGNELSTERQNEMAEQFKSPLVRNMTVVMPFVTGLLLFLLYTLFVTFILKFIISAIKKERIKFSLILKIILFTSIIYMIQIILKNSITITGDWLRALKRANDTSSLQMALQTPISLAALLDPGKTGKIIYFLIDFLTDIFNWLYYVFLYAGLKVAVKLEKKQALLMTVIIAVISLLIGLIPQLL